MKTLSIKQPWASLIMCGVKRVENRTWSTPHRGPLLIHASGKYDHAGVTFLEEKGIAHLSADDAPRGAILGTVELVDVVDSRRQQSLFDNGDEHNLDEDPLAFGPVCWIVTDPRPLAEPIPTKGKLSLWEYDLETTTAKN